MRRVWEHKEKILPGFTEKYSVNVLVHYEIYSDIRLAIEREKQLKNGTDRGNFASLNNIILIG